MPSSPSRWQFCTLLSCCLGCWQQVLQVPRPCSVPAFSTWVWPFSTLLQGCQSGVFSYKVCTCVCACVCTCVCVSMDGICFCGIVNVQHAFSTVLERCCRIPIGTHSPRSGYGVGGPHMSCSLLPWQHTTQYWVQNTWHVGSYSGQCPVGGSWLASLV